MSVFEVKDYFFQIAMWECFGNSLGCDSSVINDSAPNHFQRNLLEYGLNKSIIPRLEANKTDYFMIDTQCFVTPVYYIKYHGKETYIQHFRGKELLPKLQEKLGNSDFKFKIISIDEVPKDRVENGLKLFAEKINEIYKPDEIILYAPYFVDRRVEGYNFEELPYSIKEINKERNRKIRYYFKILRKYLPKAYVLDFDINRAVADDYAHSKNIYSVHYSNKTYIEQGFKLLELLNLNYHEWYPYDMDPFEYMMEYYMKCYSDSRKMIADVESLVTGKEIRDLFEKLPVSAIISLKYNYGFLNVREIAELILENKIYH